MYRKFPKYRKQITINQIEALGIVYRYRFVSDQLLSRYLNKRSMYRQLRLLEVLGLVGRRYEARQRLAGKPVGYYVSANGMRVLRSKSLIKDIKVEYAYKAQRVSQQFIDHCLNILTISLTLKELYGDRIKFFTKVDLNKDVYDYFPKPLPDAYIRIKGDDNEIRYFVDLYQRNQPLFTITNRIDNYIRYLDSGEWDDLGVDFPVVLVS